jgi:cyclopropane fatty-acyl-phospholipid synthase-like methyltransferase
MSQSPAPSPETVTAFYANVDALRILFGESIHVGYWPTVPDDIPLATAQDHLTDLVAGHAGIGEGERLLDVGCGTGGPARRIARTTGAVVTGIAISPHQIAAAASNRQGPRGHTGYHVADAAHLPFGSASFDAAIAIESMMHMPDKRRVLREIVRVLRPGARLVVADFVEHDLEPLPTGAASSQFDSMTSIPTQDGWEKLTKEAGFQVEDVTNISMQTRPSHAHLRRRLTVHRTELIAACGNEQVAMLEGMVALLGAAVDNDLVGYTLLTARKPAPQPEKVSQRLTL